MPRAEPHTSSSQQKLPEVGDLVIATVQRITSHGAYATMDEYIEHECFIHISEIASTWVRNIRNFVRENQKIVLKVLRVDPSRRQVDTSLRRVTKEQSRMKIQEWKRAQRGSKLLALAAERMKKTPEEAYEIAGQQMATAYSDMLEALEETKEKGPKILTDLGIPKKWAELLYELAQAHVIVREVSVEKTIELICRGPEGVEGVRKALLAAEEIVTPDGGEVFLEGAPRYRIRVMGKDYKQAEHVLEKAVEKSFEVIKACGGEGQMSSAS
ncbi:MAG: translation initiation factor IF-2 subunit alpha [Candidatus Hodarchaeota archaeon]